jgi:aspartyl-tRNA(Asn)/glutamyl-tRNA(Gln) amidotransferase subunit A
LRTYTSQSAILSDIQSGQLKLRDLVQHYLRQIEGNKHLNAFLETFSEEALARAAEVEQRIQSGKAGKLAGMVISLKDNICYKGHKVSASSKILAGFESLYSATVVERILEEDAIIIGRTNCDEFAMGASTENSAFGPVLNYADTTRVPGGSSGGCAVSVQADMCLASLGSDTGGSIRQPAAFCGLYGLKPTYGRISRWGLIAYASSFDQIGPVTKSVEDMALLLEVMAGADGHDATASSKPAEAYSKLLNSDKKYKIAYIKDCLDSEGIDAEVKAQTLVTIEQLKAAGHEVVSVEFPYLDYMVPTYYVLTTAEASSNLARFSGLHYGYRSANATDMESSFRKSRSEGFGPEVKRRIMLGTLVLSAEHYDAYYTKGLKVRRVIRNATDALLKDNDFLLLPTTPTPAFKLGEKAANPVSMYLADIFTVQANISGNPAVTIPVGKHSNGMPYGLQLMGRHFEEASLLAFAKQVMNEQATAT